MDFDWPALAPPEGVTPQLDNPPNKNGLAVGVLSTFCYSLLFLSHLLQIISSQDIPTRRNPRDNCLHCFWGATYSLFALINVPGYFVHTWNVRLRDVTDTNYARLLRTTKGKKLTFYHSGYSSSASATRSTSPPSKSVSSSSGVASGSIGSRRKSPFWLGCASIIFVQITANIGIIVALNLQCGQITAQIARMHGSHILGTCLSNEKQFAVDTLRFADEQLISIDPELSSEEVIRSVRDKGVDIILSRIHYDGTVLRLLLECDEPGGHVVEVANVDGEIMETLSLADLPRNVCLIFTARCNFSTA
ncbi:hypothetical protein BDW75DRAFT_243684 [Aspergillus navahoensis]